MAVKSKSRGSYHHGDLRAALVEAAVAMAEEEGIDAITTRALARKVGVSHAAPGRHFADRNALIAEIAAVAYERFGRALVRAAEGESDPFAQLSALGRAYVRFGMDHPALLRLMFSPTISKLGTLPPRLAETSTNSYAALRNVVRAVLGEDAPEERVDLGAFTAWSLVHGIVTLWLDGTLPHGFPERGRRKRFLEMADAAVDVASRTVAALR